MSFAVKNGQASVVLRFKLLDSTSTVGAGLTGLTSASSGLRISTIADNEATATAYTQAGSTIEAVTTLGTFAAPTATKCRFKEVDATNHPGLYEFQFADARFAVSSAKSLIISVSGATNQVQADFVVPLVVDDPYVAKLTDKTGYSLSQTFPSNFSALLISAGGHISNVDTLTTYTGNTVQTGDAYARIGAAGAGLTAIGDTRVAHLDADVSSRMATYTQPTGFLAATFPATVASPTNITAGTITTVTNLTNAPTAGDFTATMKTSLNAATPAVTVSDKTGFKLASDGVAAVTAWTVAITGNITGNLSGSVGSVTGLTASNLDATVSSRLPTSGYTAPDNTSITAIKAKTDNLPASPAAVGSAMTLTVAYDAAKTASQAGDAMTLTGAYDAAKTAATQTSVDDIPTNAELATALAGADDAVLAAIAALPTTSTVMPADIKKVNGVTVNGDGAATPWGP